MNENAKVMPRILAFVIDALISWIPFFIPVIGGIFGSLYLLFKDGIMFQITKKDEWKNKSIGKKIMNLEIVNLEGKYIDLTLSAKRNLPLTIGNFIVIIPVLGWVVGPIAAMVAAIVELIFFLIDDEHQRLGDRWANTRVISTVPAEIEEKTTI